MSKRAKKILNLGLVSSKCQGEGDESPCLTEEECPDWFRRTVNQYNEFYTWKKRTSKRNKAPIPPLEMGSTSISCAAESPVRVRSTESQPPVDESVNILVTAPQLSVSNAPIPPLEMGSTSSSCAAESPVRVRSTESQPPVDESVNILVTAPPLSVSNAPIPPLEMGSTGNPCAAESPVRVRSTESQPPVDESVNILVTAPPLSVSNAPIPPLEMGSTGNPCAAESPVRVRSTESQPPVDESVNILVTAPPLSVSNAPIPPLEMGSTGNPCAAESPVRVRSTESQPPVDESVNILVTAPPLSVSNAPIPPLEMGSTGNPCAAESPVRVRSTENQPPVDEAVNILVTAPPLSVSNALIPPLEMGLTGSPCAAESPVRVCSTESQPSVDESVNILVTTPPVSVSNESQPSTVEEFLVTSLPLPVLNVATSPLEMVGIHNSCDDDHIIVSTRPVARRQLFVENIDSWPIVLRDDNGNEIEVECFQPDFQDDDNVLIDNGNLETETNGSSGSGGKRKRKNHVTDTPAARKRQCNPKQWLAYQRKQARNAGESYVNDKGKLVPAKVVGPPCGSSCKFKCCDKVSLEERQKILKSYNAVPTAKGKWDLIARLVNSAPPKNIADDTISGRNRSCARQFFFIINKVAVRVCRTMFLNTFCISETKITTVFKKLDKDFTISPDKRGGHNQRPHKISEAIKKSVLDHINSFPRVSSHLCRAETSFQYLEQGLGSVANMYRLYLQWAPQNNVEKLATKRQYQDYFNNTPGLKIAFFQPKKDWCTVCFSYNHLSAEDRELRKAEYESHRLEKDIPQNLKREDRTKAEKMKENIDFCAAVFDLQKVLFVPQCNASDLYYKRKFSNYNFTVWDMGQHEGTCYCWHEAIAQRGSNEIASFLMDFLLKKAAQGIKVFHLYCDNCSGQNKNRMVFAMLMHVATKCNVKIVLRFLMTGHTQNEGDSVHAAIESKVKNKELFIPEDWWQLIETTREPNQNQPRSSKPYTVNRVTQEDIYDFHHFVEKLSKWNITVDGMKPTWKDVQEISFGDDPQNPWLLTYKTDFRSETPILVNTRLQKRGHPVNLKTYVFPRAYTDGPLSISSAKLKDLLSYCSDQSPVIHKEKQAFYHGLTSSTAMRPDEYYQE